MVRVQRHAHRARGGLKLPDEGLGRRVARAPERRTAGDVRRGVLQELEPLAGDAVAVGERHAGDVAARPRQIRDDAAGDRIARAREHDRQRGRRLTRGAGTDRRPDHQHVDAGADQLVDERREPLGVAVREAHLDDRGASVDVAEVAQALHEGFVARPAHGGRQEADAGQPRRTLSPRTRRRRQHDRGGGQEPPATLARHAHPEATSRARTLPEPRNHAAGCVRVTGQAPVRHRRA
jgi:hypothetical protein